MQSKETQVKDLINPHSICYGRCQDSGQEWIIKPQYTDDRTGELHDMRGFMFLDDSNFIGGHLKVRGKDEGRYPFHFLEMIDYVFGREPNTVEVCSRSVAVDKVRTACTVDIDSKQNPSVVTDGQTLAGIPNSTFRRWRSDPPYNSETSDAMYGCKLPSFIKLLEAGVRVCKTGSLMFLLLGPTNYQFCPEGVRRIGLVYISVIPNNETRALNIYYKYADSETGGYQGQLI